MAKKLNTPTKPPTLPRGFIDINKHSEGLTKIAPNVYVQTRDLMKGGKVDSKYSQQILKIISEGEQLSSLANKRFGVSIDRDTAWQNRSAIEQSVKTGLPVGVVQEALERKELSSQAKSFGFDIPQEVITQYKPQLQAAFGYETKKPTFGDAEITFDALADYNNTLVEQYNLVVKDIEKEQNPFIQQKILKEELEPLGSRIQSVQSDYEKLAKVVQEKQPVVVDVAGFGKGKNRLKEIKMFRENISAARQKAYMEAGDDPYKKQAVKIVDEPNLANLEKQLMREEKVAKLGMGQSFVSRGALQPPQIIGGPEAIFATPTYNMPKSKSNILSGLPSSTLDINLGGKSSADARAIERQFMKQATQSNKSRSSKRIENFFGGDSNIFG